MTTETFELVPARETCWSRDFDPEDLVLMLMERDAVGEKLGGTRIATFSNMRFMDSLGPRLAKLCLETAQAELAKAGGVPPRAPATGPEPFARLGDDVVVCDFNWEHPKWHSPRDWIFHDVKRGRRLFDVSKAHAGDAPSQQILLALLSAFAAGERAGRDAGVTEGRAELASDIRALIGAAAAQARRQA